MNKVNAKINAEISNKEFSEIFDKIKNEQNVDKLKSIFVNELPIVLNERLKCCNPELNKFGFLKNIMFIFGFGLGKVLPNSNSQLKYNLSYNYPNFVNA